MAVSNELAKPHSEDDFEAMCHSLYRLMWNDTSCCRIGGPGQSQFGIDIIGNDGKKTVGIQCKHYNKKLFTLTTVTNDIALADEAKLDIDHMLFSTTAANKSALVLAVHKLSNQRKCDGKFTVSVDFWEEISGHLRLYPQVGRVYIRNFPGADVLEIKETTETHFRLYESDRETTGQFQSAVLNSHRNVTEQLEALLNREVTPTAKGDEADPKVVATLDLIRDMIRGGKCSDAKQLLETLGDAKQFKDQFSRFRWYTNRGAIALQEGNIGDAATEFLNAFEFASDNEKAHLNKVHAYILLKDITAAEFACEQGIANFPKSASLWALSLNVRLLQGDNNPEWILPESILETIDILYAKAYLADKRGDFQLASELFYRCLQMDAASFDVKRAYLASALSWVCLDQVLAYHGQITETQRTTLENALVQLEPLEQLLPSIQSEHVSIELTNNVAISLMVLGQIERGRLLAVISLRRHPLTEGLLRIRLQELEQRNDLAEIHKLTDDWLSDLSPVVLGILAEISANHGQLEWHKKVMSFVEYSSIKPEDLNELRTLSMQAKWMSGARKEAIEEAKAYLQNNHQHILSKVILSNFLIRIGQRDEAIKHATNCLPQLGEEARTLDVLHVAELLFQLNLYREAEKLYARLVLTLGNDEFTRKWLICMIESDQRRRAQDTINKLPTTIRELSMFVRIEANLARCSGDWKKMRDLLGKELERTPDDSRIALGYVGALHRLEDKTILPEYLRSDPKFKDTTVEEEFEFAKYQDFHGYTKLAIRRLYRLYLRNPGNSDAASFYLGHVLLGKQGIELSPPLNVEPGTVVHLRTSSETRIVAIDFENDIETQCWPELISPNDELAKLLFNRAVGESIIVQNGFGEKAAEIIALESIYAFAASKAHAQVAAAAVPSGPIWSVKIIKESGELDIEPLLESARQRKAQVNMAFENYKQNRFPLALLSKAIGSDPVTLVTEWPYKNLTLFVGIGTHEERTASTEILRSKAKRYVLDLLTIAELVNRKAFKSAIRILGVPLVPHTLRERLLMLQQFSTFPRESATLSEEGGNLQLTETNDEYFNHHDNLLSQMLDCIDQYCEVVPTLGPTMVTPIHRTLAQVLDRDSLDAIFLAVERDAVLVSEDGALRLLSPEAGVKQSIGIQPILMEACVKGFLSKDSYADIVIEKLCEGHDFVSVRSEDLLALATRTPNRISKGVRVALETFRLSTLDIISGVQVACNFLHHLIGKLQPCLVAEYGKLVLDVLQFERPELAATIHIAVADSLEDALQIKGRKLNSRERGLFVPLLNAPSRPQILLRKTPLALAIQTQLQGRSHR